MPRIADIILDCTFFIYQSQKSAEDGELIGGTGFFIGVESKKLVGYDHLYAVTNKHVIDSIIPTPTLRLNNEEGKIFPFETIDTDWEKSNIDDLAVYSIGKGLDSRVKHSYIGESSFLTKKGADTHQIGVGDEVYMAGRFIGLEGKVKNTPSARFGNISIMHPDPIEIFQPKYYKQEAILVEMRSRSGYSGSPVHVYFPLNWWRLSEVTIEPKAWLLGVDFAGIPLHEKIRRRNPHSRGTEDHPMNGFVDAHSGLIAVIPAWKLTDLLYLPKLVKEREILDDEKIEELEKQGKNVELLKS